MHISVRCARVIIITTLGLQAILDNEGDAGAR